MGCLCVCSCGQVTMTCVGLVSLWPAGWAPSGLLGSQSAWLSARTWQAPSLSPDVLADEMEVR